MSNSAIGKAALIVSADTNPLIAGLNQAQSEINNWGNSLYTKLGTIGNFMGTYFQGGFKKATGDLSNYLQSKIQAAQKALAGKSGFAASAASLALPIAGALVAGIGLAGQAWDTFKNKAFEIFADIGEKAKIGARFGISTTGFQELLAGTRLDPEALATSVNHLQRSISNLSLGNREAQGTFAQLQLTAADFGSNTEDNFRTVVAAFGNITNEGDRARLAFSVFGRSAQEMLPALRNGMDGAIARARELGLILGEEQVAAIQQTNRAWKETQQIFQGVWTQLAGNLAPVFRDVAEAVKNFWTLFQPVFRNATDLVGQWARFITAAFQELLIVLEPVGRTIREFFGGGENLDVSGIVSAVASVYQAFVHFYATIINLLNSLAQGILSYLVAPSLRFWAMFVDGLNAITPSVVNVVNFILNAINELAKGFLRYLVAPSIETNSRIISAFQTLVPALVNIFNAAIQSVQGFMRGVISPILEGIRVAVRAVYNVMNELPDVIADRIPGFVALRDAVDGAASGLAGARDSVNRLANTPLRLDPNVINATLNNVRQNLDNMAQQVRANADGMQPWQLNAEAIQATLTNVSATLRQAGINADFVAEMLDEWMIDPDQIDAFFERVMQRARQAGQQVRQEMAQAFDPALLQRAFEISSRFTDPLDKFQSEVAELQQLFSMGLIDSDVFSRAMEDAMRNAEQALNIKPIQQAQAMMFGSREAANIAYQAQFGNQQANDPAERLIRIQEQGNRNTARVADNTAQLINVMLDRGDFDLLLI